MRAIIRNGFSLISVSLAFAGIFSLKAASQDFNADIIYGSDDRRELYEYADNDIAVYLARSTCVLMLDKYVSQISDDYSNILAVSLEEKAGPLCKSEPFRNQPATGECSGFLVTKDTIITASHCIPNNDFCKNMMIIFDYFYDSDISDPTLINNNNIYYCSEVIKTVNDYDSGIDFSIIKLNRKVMDRMPLKYRKKGMISDRSPLFVIGNPLGLPTKIAGNAYVRNNEDPYFFTSNLDTYEGNSGSAVFNSKTGLVEGILVRGERDFVWDGDCLISNKCSDDGCHGEDVVRATVFAPYIHNNYINNGLALNE